ncbi:MAG: DNA polymerase I [Ignavibacteria bacterium]|nr:DNA polymerase I [Ignavibacteria bacterium]
MAHPDRLFLLDGMALAYRAYFALIARPLMNSKGENTSAVYGFVNTLLKILSEERPEYLAVVFDAKGKTFRHDRYSEYKATRQKMPEDMAGQMDALKAAVKGFNAPLLEIPGYEADDVIGTLARKAEQEGVHSYMVTGDKDFMQLISPLISIYKPGKSGADPEIIDRESVATRFGVSPDKVIEVLGLMGDSSDNVPGVPGIGPKTAIPLIQKYGTIPELYDKLDEIPQKGVREKLRKNRDSAFLSRDLVTIRTEVPLAIDFHELKAAPPDTAELIRLFEQLEFRTLVTRMKRNPPRLTMDAGKPVAEPAIPEPEPSNTILTEPHDYRCILTHADLVALLPLIEKASRISVTTLRTSSDPLRSGPIGMSLCMRPSAAYFIPLKGKQPPEGRGWSDVMFTSGEALEILRPVLENPLIGKIGHDIKTDFLSLSTAGVSISGVVFDTMVASYLLRSDARHRLDALSKEHLDYTMIPRDGITGTGKDQRPITAVPLTTLAEYLSEQSDIALKVSDLQQKRLSEAGMKSLCSEVEFPLISVLGRMERAGIRLDVDYLAEMSVDLEKHIAKLIEQIHTHAGESFNINSTQQLAEILFSRLGLRTVRKTKTGFSTDASVLEALRNDHPIVEDLLRYRLLTKLKSTYVDALPQLVNPHTGRLHTSLSQTVAATGRLASNDPNLQNIPIRTEEGRAIRRAFVPAESGLRLLSADYSQIELRVMAHISGDPGLTEAFRNHEDIHTSTAAKVFGVQLKEVSSDMRRKAKEVNFGIMYGLSPFGLANRLEIAQSEAKEIIANYFQRFPSVKDYIVTTIESARKDGYVSTLLGRRRYLPDINSRNGNVRSNAERQAINMPIQGSAADMIKKAMIIVERELASEGLGATMLLQVHDELLFEVPTAEIEETTRIVSERMKSALPLSVPVEVDVGSGMNWLEAH